MWVGWVLGRVCRGVWGVSGGGLWGEKVSLAPLYYPDTLVNPDTCLGLDSKSQDNLLPKGVHTLLGPTPQKKKRDKRNLASNDNRRSASSND